MILLSLVPKAPYCKVTFKICRNPACGRPFAVVSSPDGRCKECRRCRRDGYCSLRCRIDAKATKQVLVAIGAPPSAAR